MNRPKAEVAAEIVSKMSPELEVRYHHRNIMEGCFDLRFFAGFKVVILALDNEEARSYVNKQCMISKTLVLEAGTHGLLGQVGQNDNQAMILRRNVTRCYDCYPRAKSKTFQVCTLRTLPDKPIHCLIWAKHVFGLVFGNHNDENLLQDLFEKVNEESLLAEGDLAKGVFQLLLQLFRKLYRELLEEQKKSNPEKFIGINLIADEQIEASVSFERLAGEFDYEVDVDKVQGVDFYIYNFFSMFASL